jgi:hypothetical protein
MLIGFLVTTAWRMKVTANILNKQSLTAVEGCELGGQFTISHHEKQAILRIKQASGLNVFCGTIYLRKI